MYKHVQTYIWATTKVYIYICTYTSFNIIRDWKIKHFFTNWGVGHILSQVGFERHGLEEFGGPWSLLYLFWWAKIFFYKTPVHLFISGVEISLFIMVPGDSKMMIGFRFLSLKIDKLWLYEKVLTCI